MKKELQCLLIISLLLMSLVTVPAFQGNYVKADSENVFITVDSSNFPSEVVLRISLNVSETLTARDFEVYENGVRQQITDVYYTGEGLIMPIDVVFIIDRSDSMDSYIEAVKDSAYQFSRDLEKIGGDNVRFALVTFADNDDARIDLPLTNNVSKFVKALDSIYTAGGTEWSFGGILKALDLKFNPNAQKVFIVVTDEDDQSPYSVEEVANNLTAEGVLLALVYNHGYGQKLSALSEMVGALDIDISEVQQNGFEEVLHYITTTIGQQYQVVYTPTNQSMDGNERLVRVVIHLPNGDSLEANASYIAEERPKERYEEIMPTDQEIYEILTKIDQWFDEAEEYIETNNDLEGIFEESVNAFLVNSNSDREYIPKADIPTLFSQLEPIATVGGILSNSPTWRFYQKTPRNIALSKEEIKLLSEFLEKEVNYGENLKIGDITISLQYSMPNLRRYQVTTTSRTFYLDISDHTESYTVYLDYNKEAHIMIYKYEVKATEKLPLPDRSIYSHGCTWNIQNIHLTPSLDYLAVFAYDEHGNPVTQYESDKLNTLVNIDNFTVTSGCLPGKKVLFKTSNPWEELYIQAGFEGLIPKNIINTSLPLFPLFIQGRIYPAKLTSFDGYITKIGASLKVGGILGDITITRAISGWSGPIWLNRNRSFLIAEKYIIFELQSLPRFGSILGNKDKTYAELVELIEDMPEDYREHVYLEGGLEASGYLGFDILGNKLKLGVSSAVYNKNNLEKRNSNSYRFIHASSIKLFAGAGVSVELAGVSAKIGIPIYGEKIIDPQTVNETTSIRAKFLNDAPSVGNLNMNYSYLALTFNITTNTPGTYYAIPTLLVNGSVVAAQGFNITLHNGSNVITFNIPGQYVYSTHHDGSFEVGLVINDANGTLVYSNFTLGTTKPYDYNDFAHVVPAFDIEYSPVDMDSDGLYDKLVVNITEKTGLKGITLAPALTAPGWIVYLNSTNLTSTTTYTLSIDGMHVRKFMGNFSLILYVANMTSGVYLGSYNWSINVDPMKFESAYPTIVDVIPRTINYKPAVTFTVNVSRDSNISIILKYDVGGLVYDAWGYFENVTPGIQNFTVFLDPSAFVLNGTRKATLLSATLIANDLTTDSVKINKEVSFLLLSRADVLNIDQKLNAVKKLLNMTIDLISYEDVNSTVVVVLSSGNATLTTLVYPEIHEGTILELPVTFNLSGILSNISENGTLSVVMYDENGELLKMKTVNVNLSPLFTPGHLKVYSNPSGASVYIDGVYFGITPLEVDLLPGEYTLELSKEGYQKLILPVTINSGESKTIYATLSPSPIPATLEISSFPSGAKVYIDDEPKGLTPLTVEVSPGTHTVKLTRVGYHDYVTTITVDQGESVTINVRLTPSVNYAPFSIGDYPIVVDNATSVFFVFNNYGTPDAFSVSQYVSRTLPIDKRAVSRLAREFDFNEVTPNDLIISVGGPLVNNVTARYDTASGVHMSIEDRTITIVTPEGNFTWTAPRPWWNISQGYFIIQAFYDSEFNVTVFTIYGTDADSTAAGAYYFLTEVYPNISDYSDVTYLVGLWEDTESGADIPLPGAGLGDTSGFSAGDSITIVAQG